MVCAGERVEEVEGASSWSASRWKVPQHLPHLMLCCCILSIFLMDNKQCWSLHRDSLGLVRGFLAPGVEAGLIIHLGECKASLNQTMFAYLKHGICMHS